MKSIYHISNRNRIRVPVKYIYSNIFTRLISGVVACKYINIELDFFTYLLHKYEGKICLIIYFGVKADPIVYIKAGWYSRISLNEVYKAYRADWLDRRKQLKEKRRQQVAWSWNESGYSGNILDDVHYYSSNNT